MLMRGVMGGNAQVIEWSHTHNMNDYKDAGTYRIKGERTGNPLSDNLPIMNSGSGHTIEGILYVLDSSLTNGSGNSDDCTITQFLMLSNRVGGQEGDMYMRSAYGANKDSLVWKPWEKYQTNMEVGAVSDYKLLNPSNPTQVIGQQGMTSLTDNGIYSGVYVGPKAMIGTADDEYTMIFNDPTGIETFVMVVVNNYAAASNARCVTQIKFAVTNGGVFSMEKRSTDPGTLSWSQWESVGGGGSSLGEWDSNGDGFDIYNPVDLAKSIAFGNNINIGTNVNIGRQVVLGESTRSGGWSDIGIYSELGPHAHIGYNVNIGNAANIDDKINVNIGNDSDYSIEYGIALGTGDAIGGIIKIGQNVRIPNNLKFSISDNILTITNGTNTWKLTAE